MRYASDPLTNYLVNFARRPYELGVTDCVQFLAEWVAVVMGDPALVNKWKGYHTKPEAMRMFGGQETMGQIVDRELRQLGWRDAEALKPGCIVADNVTGIVCDVKGAVAVVENHAKRLVWIKASLSNFNILTFW